MCVCVFLDYSSRVGAQRNKIQATQENEMTEKENQSLDSENFIFLN